MPVQSFQVTILQLTEEELKTFEDFHRKKI